MEKPTNIIELEFNPMAAIIYVDSNYSGFISEMHKQLFTYGVRISNPNHPIIKRIQEENPDWDIKCLILPVRGTKEFIA